MKQNKETKQNENKRNKIKTIKRNETKQNRMVQTNNYIIVYDLF